MKIILHGGLIETVDTTEIKLIKNALKLIATQAFEYLLEHNAFETAVYTVSLLENNPLFDAGTGSAIQADERIRMSAAICDGHRLTMSGVINIMDVKNPILVAEKLMPLDDKVLAGTEALQFAREQGFEYYNPEIEKQRKEFEKKKKSTRHGTVGCVVIDRDKHIAAATSTGGLGAEFPGRVADSATVAGTYANSYCGVSCSGTGEDIVNNAVAVKVVTRVTDGLTVKQAIKKTMKEINQANGDAGIIALDRDGTIYSDASKAGISYVSFDGSTLDIFKQ